MEQLYKFTPEQLREIESITLDFDTSNMAEGTIQAAKIRKYMMDNNLISPAQAGESNSWSLVSEKKPEMSKEVYRELRKFNRISNDIYFTHRNIRWEIENLRHTIKNNNIKLSINLLWFVAGIICGMVATLI